MSTDTHAAPAEAPARPRGGWPAVLAATAGTFTVVTSEMLPVGLLTPLSAELRVTEGVAGMAMTVPGLVAAVAAPLLTVTTARLDRKRVLIALMALFAVANLLTAWAPDITVLLAARVLVGVGIGGVWSIAAGLAARLVPERSVGRAMSAIFGGVALASVLGMPLGTWIGGVADWRTAFVVVGGVALLVLGLLAALMPPLPPADGIRLGAIPELLRSRAMRTGLLIVLLLVGGYFAAFTYVRPALELVPGMTGGLIGVLLLANGAAGVAGNFVAGVLAVRGPGRVLVTIGVALALVQGLIPVLGGTVAGAAVLLVLWGLAAGGISVSVQAWMFAEVPRTARELVSALFTSSFNVAIAAGALTGGRMADGISVPAALWLGAVLVAGAALVAGRARTIPKTP